MTLSGSALHNSNLTRNSMGLEAILILELFVVDVLFSFLAGALIAIKYTYQFQVQIATYNL